MKNMNHIEIVAGKNRAFLTYHSQLFSSGLVFRYTVPCFQVHSSLLSGTQVLVFRYTPGRTLLVFRYTPNCTEQFSKPVASQSRKLRLICRSGLHSPPLVVLFPLEVSPNCTEQFSRLSASGNRRAKRTQVTGQYRRAKWTHPSRF